MGRNIISFYAGWVVLFISINAQLQTGIPVGAKSGELRKKNSTEYDLQFIEKNILNTTSNFGYSLSDIGDFNGDGINDFAIGAVNADDNHGRIYIYFGGSDLNGEADFILYGGNDVYGLGNSLAGVGDLNNDGFDDLAVSYKEQPDIYLCAVYFGQASPDTIPDLILAGEKSPFYKFGNKVNAAGDVNNDGYDDIIVGDKGYNDYDGRAYVFLGGAEMDSTFDFVLSPIIADTTYDSAFGNDVTNVGDVNNDGYDDVVVGAYYDAVSTGSAYLFFGGEDMDTNFTKIILPVEEQVYGGNFGQSVSGAGDFNNDGFDDFVIGTAREPGTSQGKAYVYFGAEQRDVQRVDSIPGMILTIDETAHYVFGYSVTGNGDLNNDGFSDIAVGAVGANVIPGKALIFYGGTEPDSIADVSLDCEPGVELLNEDKLGFGSIVSMCGDLNNDGTDDILIGNNPYYIYSGKCYLYFGGNPFDTNADINLDGKGENLFHGYASTILNDINDDGFDDILLTSPGYWTDDLSDFGIGRAYLYFGGADADSIVDVIFKGERNVGHFGLSATPAGDFNNDGYNDFVIGAYNKAYLYYGGPGFDNIADVVFEGSYYKQELGNSVSCAGDVNNDGFDDVIIGAWGSDAYKGEAFIFLGNNSGDADADVVFSYNEMVTYFGYTVSGIGDINNDGYDDVAVSDIGLNYKGRALVYFGGENMDNEPDLSLYGEFSTSNFGRSISPAGDFNNDGFDDFIVSDEIVNDTGRVYLFLGGNEPDGNYDLVFDGGSTGANFGWSITGDEDLNNDGIDDIVIGACGSESSVGRINIYYGGSAPDSNSDMNFTGEYEGDMFGWSVSVNGDINGDNTVDLLTGACKYPDNGAGYLFLGSPQVNTETYKKLPIKFSLEQNYPNPFNPETSIKYTLREVEALHATSVHLGIYNLLGQEIAILVNEQQPPGNYKVKFDASGLSSGVYFYRLKAGKFVETKKMVLMR